jgi:hypothetical protein
MKEAKKKRATPIPPPPGYPISLFNHDWKGRDISAEHLQNMAVDMLDFLYRFPEITADQRIQVVKLALDMEKRRKKFFKAKGVRGPLFGAEVDFLIKELGLEDEKQEDYARAIVFHHYRQCRPEYKNYSDATLNRYYRKSKAAFGGAGTTLTGPRTKKR